MKRTCNIFVTIELLVLVVLGCSSYSSREASLSTNISRLSENQGQIIAPTPIPSPTPIPTPLPLTEEEKMAISIDARAQELIESGVITTMENQKIPPERHRGVIINEDKYRTYQVLLFGPSPYFSNAYKYEILPRTLVYIEMPPGFYHHRMFNEEMLISGDTMSIGYQEHSYEGTEKFYRFDNRRDEWIGIEGPPNYREIGFRRLNSAGDIIPLQEIMERARYEYSGTTGFTTSGDVNYNPEGEGSGASNLKSQLKTDYTRYTLWENFVLKINKQGQISANPYAKD